MNKCYAFLLITMTFTVKTAFSAEAAGILKDGMHKGEILVESPDPVISRLSQKFKAALSRNAAWFRQYQQQHQGALPWHKNMGLSQKEYETLQSRLKSVTLKKAGDIKVKILKVFSGIAVTSHRSWKFLDRLNVRIDPGLQKASVAGTQLTRVKKVSASKGQQLTGPWDGRCWTHTSVNGKETGAGTALPTASDHLKKVELCIGKMKKTGRGILIYSARDNRSRNPQKNSDFTVKWDRGLQSH